MLFRLHSSHCMQNMQNSEAILNMQSPDGILSDILEKEKREEEAKAHAYDDLCTMFPNLEEDLIHLVFHGANFQLQVAIERLLKMSESQGDSSYMNNELALMLEAMGIPVPPSNIGESDDQRLAAMLQVYYSRLEKKIIRKKRKEDGPPDVAWDEKISIGMLCGTEGSVAIDYDLQQPRNPSQEYREWERIEREEVIVGHGDTEARSRAFAEGYAGSITQVDPNKEQRNESKQEYTEDSFVSADTVRRRAV
mmetsp:Transcript_9646/g.12596  ORF Transcript_9646/g.12596 Transcript_9646/m.12596 type:complete len:251 (+) Transcript_9646:36-788(+)